MTKDKTPQTDTKTGLSYAHIIKNLKLIERNREWLADTGVSKFEKVDYYWRVAASILMKKNKIKYLGADLYYDNPATPLNLQNYPYEIAKKIIANMDKEPMHVLDIGGNLGQFSLTTNSLLQKPAHIDVFEPNSFVFEFLKKNTKKYDNIHIHNYGLGEKDSRKILYFNPKRTGVGSLMKGNAGEGEVMEQEIAITSSPEKITKRKIYDLVKIDVEGYEYHALKALRNIKFEYLFIEFSGQGREKDYAHSEMLSTIRELWGEFDIYYCGGLSKDSDTFDLLLRVN